MSSRLFSRLGPALVLAFTSALAGCGSSSNPTPSPSGGGGRILGTGGANMWAAGERGLMAATSQGTQLAERASGTPSNLHSLVCVGDRNAWAVGAEGTVVATLDGGATWTRQSTPVTTTLRGAAFADSLLGVAVGDAATLLRTSDGGATWTQVAATSTTDLYSVTATGAGATFIAVGAQGTVLRSIDGGGSYQPVAVPSGAAATSLRAVRFAPSGRGYVVGDGGLILTSGDGGFSWSPESSAPADLNAVALTQDGATVVAVGAGGLIWRRSASAGWAAVPSATSANLNAVGFARGSFDAAPSDLGRGWVVGDSGTVLATGDGGLEFVRLASPTTRNFTTLEDF